MRSIDELRSHLRENGRRVTPQKELIAGLLADNDRHPTAEMIHAEATRLMPSLSLKTVYQVLREFEELGEIQSTAAVGGPMRFDPNTSEHHHLVCTSCGAVFDVVLDGPTPELPPTQRRGFAVEATEIVFNGVCASCQTNTHHSRAHMPVK